jgi:superfamily II RNA helicase
MAQAKQAAGKQGVRIRFVRAPVHIVDIVSELDRHNLLPTIIFRSSRNQCDIDAERAYHSKQLAVTPIHQRQLHQKVKEIIKNYDVDPGLVTSHPQYKALITTGVGAHHAGQLLIWRLMLEELMAAGLLRALVATGTVAAGVDFPARTVVITAHGKRGSEGYNALTAAEFQQMSGRAGRRGRDTVGFCVVAPSTFCDARKLLTIVHKPAEPLVSAYFPSPSTVLNLLRYRSVDGLHFAVGRSLAAYVDEKNAKALLEQASQLEHGLPEHVRAVLVVSPEEEAADEANEAQEKGGTQLTKNEKKAAKKIRRLRREAEELKGRQLQFLDAALNGLRNLGYLEGMHLSEKGHWAANLCTSIVIELAEIIEGGLLDGASSEMLAAVIASISGDKHRQYLSSKHSPLGKDKITALETIIRKVKSESMPGVVDELAALPDAAYTVVSWMYAEDWRYFRGMLALSGVAEGDAARLITQTAEHLNQLSRLTRSHKELADLAEETKLRILRPPLSEVINLETI